MLKEMISTCCLCIGIAYGQADDVDTYVRHEMEARKIPGLAFALIDHEKLVTERAYGTANLETGTPLGTDGVFELASVTKPFTATAVIMLVEQGKVGLDSGTALDRHILEHRVWASSAYSVLRPSWGHRVFQDFGIRASRNFYGGHNFRPPHRAGAAACPAT